MRIYTLIALVCLSVFPAHAADDDAHFQDWLSLTDYLRTYNIIPPQVSWAIIDPMCLPLRTSESQVAYNRCKFDKAMLERAFAGDIRTCKDNAKLAFPDSMLTAQRTRSFIETDARGNQRSIQEVVPAYSTLQLRESRENSFSQCMAALRWRSTEDWSLGKQDPETVPTVMPAALR